MVAPRIAVVQGSLTDGQETVLVNASNTNVALGSGVARGLWLAIETIGEDVTVAMVALGAGTGQLGVRAPTQIACETLARHLEKTPGTHIQGVTFYGYMLHERMAIEDVVKTHFPFLEPGHA